MFERYKQIGNITSAKKGMGIGLAIVKKILELYSVKIEVESQEGKGTAFQFVMPATAQLVFN